MRRVLPILMLLAVAGCGKNPTAPSNYAQIAGGWSGTFESNYAPEAILIDVTQSAGTINGTWAMGSGVRASGAITGTVDQASFSGSATYTYPGGPTCTASLSGVATTGATTMTWTSPGFTGNCGLVGGNPTGVRFVLQRR